MTTTAPERIDTSVGVARPRRRLLMWAMVAVALGVIVAAGLWIFVGDDGLPTATFDGTEATYSGPTSFEAGPITFKFDATDYDFEDGVAFVVVRTDESLTLTDLEALADEYPADQVPPGISLSGMGITFVGDEVVKADIRLTEGTWSLWANTSTADTNRAHPAAIFQVTASAS